MAKIVMLAFLNDGKSIDLAPGAVVDTSAKKAPFDDAEAQRLVSVGGARLQTDEEAKVEAELVEAEAAKALAAAAAKAAKNPT